MAADGLPNRRVEGWRWSDLSAALAGQNPPVAAGERNVIARLAEGAGKFKSLVVKAGESVVQAHNVGEQVQDTQATEIDVETGGTLMLVTLQRGGDIALAHRRVRLGAGATFRQFIVGDGARYARIETEIEIAGSNAKVELNSVYMVAKGRHADLTSLVKLGAPGAEVRQLVRGVARKGGRGVFQGKFLVERAAQKTDAEMQHNALLLEEGAEVFAKPELEIYADDVQCGHGNTAGQLNEDAIFYLRQRGIPDAVARAMITRAFLIEALPEWLDDVVRASVEARIDEWLRGVA